MFGLKVALQVGELLRRGPRGCGFNFDLLRLKSAWREGETLTQSGLLKNLLRKHASGIMDMHEMEAPQKETWLQMDSSARYSSIHRFMAHDCLYQARGEVSSSTYSTTSRPLHCGPPTPLGPRAIAPKYRQESNTK